MDLVQLPHQPISPSSGIVIPSSAGYSPVDTDTLETKRIPKTNGSISLGGKDEIKAPRYEELIGEIVLDRKPNIQFMKFEVSSFLYDYAIVTKTLMPAR